MHGKISLVGTLRSEQSEVRERAVVAKTYVAAPVRMDTEELAAQIARNDGIGCICVNNRGQPEQAQEAPGCEL